MSFLPKVSFNGAEDKGAVLKKSVVEYCDQSDDGIFKLQNSDESEKENRQDSENSIEDTFDDLSFKHDEEYYSSGTIPVAVINDFRGNSDSIRVCNMIKSVNPDVSITKLDSGLVSPSKDTSVGSFISDHPLIDNFVYENKLLRNLSGFLLSETQNDTIEKCLDKLLELQKSGVEYKAVNISCDCVCSYSEINRLVIQETNVEITPENIGEYKPNIKQVLETKRDKRIVSDGNKIKVSQLLNIVKKTEELNIPVYMTGNENSGGKKSFNLFSLADNAISFDVESYQTDDETSLMNLFPSSIALATDMCKYGVPNKTDYNA